MTNGANNSNRLDRIEIALEGLISGLQETKAGLEETRAIANSNSRAIQAMIEQQSESKNELAETRAIANSNSRAIQAMIEQQVTDRLKREEEKAENERRIRLIEETQRDLARTSSGVVRLLAAMDEDRPTILRRLMTIEDKVDRILER
jgi:DNA-binding FrmR family transcriptional regulator